MKVYLFFIRIYFTILSAIAPKAASYQAFRMFQKVRNKKLRKREHRFYAAANTFTAEWEKEDITCYELGDPNGKLVLLVHGWDSNAGSLSAIGFELARRGYHVVAFNLPGHGFSKLRRSNLLINAEAFDAVIRRLRISEPFSVVSHSFGSAVTTFALAKYQHQVEKLIYLTTPNQIEKVFTEFKEIVHLGDKAYELMCTHAEKLLGHSLEEVSVANLIKQVSFESFTVIHDKVDKVIPFERSKDVANAGGGKLIELNKAGHYRMLWDEKVIEMVADHFPEKEYNIVPQRELVLG